MKVGKILLWGGRSKARILSKMIEELYGRQADLIYDYSLDEPEFETDISFLNDKPGLSQRLQDEAFTHVALAIGGAAGYARVQTAYALRQKFGLEGLSLVHDRSFIDTGCTVGAGLQMMPGALVHKFCTIGSHVILNSQSTIDHECQIGNGVHIMGSAAIAGRVTIGDWATVGTNATILPDLTIGRGAYIGAGAVVIHDVEENAVVAGSPARLLRKSKPGFDTKTVEFSK